MSTSTHDELVSRLTLGPGVSVGTMFGMVTLKVGRKAFAGYAREGMVFKLTGDAHAQALSLAGAHLFDPMGGWPMNEWLSVTIRERPLLFIQPNSLEAGIQDPSRTLTLGESPTEQECRYYLATEPARSTRCTLSIGGC